MRKGIIVDELIGKVSLKPTVRGLYFYLAEKTDLFNTCYFSYKEAKKIIPVKFYKKYISNLENLGLVEKNYHYFRTSSGIIAKRNKITLIINNPVEIPEDIINLVNEKQLRLKEKGLYYSLYVMANKYGEIHGTIKELTELFDMHYSNLSANFRVLENLDLIKRESGRIRINALESILI